MKQSPRFRKRKELLVREERPFNAGPPPEVMRQSFITPTDLHFVRNHGSVPEIDVGTYRLVVDGEVERGLSLSLADLSTFPRREMVATIQCAGNRRQELAEVRPIPGELPWGFEAISTARWAGPSLADVLAAARQRSGARHVAFEGADETERKGKRFTFGGSIPIEKAGAGEVLLATEMNGEPLPPVHGAPVRVVVPGWIGARSVKWLRRIELREDPSDNYFQRVAYRLFPPGVGPENVMWEDGLMLGELAVNSMITRPVEGARLTAGPVTVEGVAIAGGGRAVARVEVTADAGVSWVKARLEPSSERWAWRLWEARLELPAGSHELAVRAFDDAAQTQPCEGAQVWNFKGYANNAWHRVHVELL